MMRGEQLHGKMSRENITMSNGFIYVVDAHFIDKIEENKYPGPKCL
jgi:hypothetical protein